MLQKIHPFLAIDHPQKSSLMVVEDWLPDHTLKFIVDEFQSGNYNLIVVTGGQLVYGRNKTKYETTVELYVAKLESFGINKNKIIGLSKPTAIIDRTYNSGIALKEWYSKNLDKPTTLNVISMGVHARRSRLLFQKALGKRYVVGIIALKSIGYDSEKWWRSSSGFRTVTGELIAYLYAKFVFIPSRNFNF